MDVLSGVLLDVLSGVLLDVLSGVLLGVQPNIQPNFNPIQPNFYPGWGYMITGLRHHHHPTIEDSRDILSLTSIYIQNKKNAGIKLLLLLFQTCWIFHPI